jgi:DNA-binding LacI/PurR family transcriptional regulator
MASSRKPTLNDVAKLAGVSPATVSRVAAGTANVDREIKASVRDAAKKLGVSLAARSRGKSKVVAFLLANRDVLHSFQARVLLGAERYCSEQGWELLFMSFHYPGNVAGEALHLPQLLSQRSSARAVILGGVNHPNLIGALEQKGLPFAVLGNNVFGEWNAEAFDVVYSDDLNGAFDGANHLIFRGHKQIAFIGNTQLPWFSRCAKGYSDAMKRANLTPRVIDLRSDGTELGFLGAKTLLTSKEPFTAVLAGSDQVALGVYQAFREAKLAVPAKVSVVGFNDVQGALFDPPMTSVREFPEELGRHLAELILRRIEDPSLPPQQVVIPAQVESRSSVMDLR